MATYVSACSQGQRTHSARTNCCYLITVTRLALHTIHPLKKWFSCPALDTGYSLGFDSVGNSNLIRVHFTTTQYS